MDLLARYEIAINPTHPAHRYLLQRPDFHVGLVAPSGSDTTTRRTRTGTVTEQSAGLGFVARHLAAAGNSPEAVDALLKAAK